MTSFEKIVWLLKRLGCQPYELSLSELSKEMGVGRSGLYKMLAVLQREGLVSRGDNKKYSLGPVLYGLGTLYYELKGLHGVAEPVMQRVSSITQETVSLGIREGDDAILIAKIESSYDIRLFDRVGKKYPCNAGAIGKILAAYLDQERINSLLFGTELVKKTPNTIVTIPELKCEYEKIRVQGFAVSDSENTPGAFGMSAPIRNKNGQVYACICVAGPKERFTTEKIQAWIPVLIEAGKEISQRLVGSKNN